MIALHEIKIPGPWSRRRWGELQLAVIWFYGFRDQRKLKFDPSTESRNYRFYRRENNHWMPVVLDRHSLEYIHRRWAQDGKPMPNIDEIVIE